MKTLQFGNLGPEKVTPEKATPGKATPGKATPGGAMPHKAMFDLRLQNHRFDVALNNLVQGVCFFDGAKRLILANRRYAEIYGLTLDSIQPGTTLKEIVER